MRVLSIAADNSERGLVSNHNSHAEPWGLYMGSGWKTFAEVGEKEGRPPEFRPGDQYKPSYPRSRGCEPENKSERAEFV